MMFVCYYYKDLFLLKNIIEITSFWLIYSPSAGYLVHCTSWWRFDIFFLVKISFFLINVERACGMINLMKHFIYIACTWICMNTSLSLSLSNLLRSSLTNKKWVKVCKLSSLSISTLLKFYKKVDHEII